MVPPSPRSLRPGVGGNPRAEAGPPSSPRPAKVLREQEAVAAAPQCREDGAAGDRKGAQERRVAE